MSIPLKDTVFQLSDLMTWPQQFPYWMSAWCRYWFWTHCPKWLCVFEENGKNVVCFIVLNAIVLWRKKLVWLHEKVFGNMFTYLLQVLPRNLELNSLSTVRVPLWEMSRTSSMIVT